MKYRITAVLALLLLATSALAGELAMQATPDPRVKTLTWTANTESDLQGYKVYRATTSGAYVKGQAFAQVGVLAAPSYTTPQLANGTWFFVVTAFNGNQPTVCQPPNFPQPCNESGFSNEVSVTINFTPAPTPPTGLQIAQALRDMLLKSQTQIVSELSLVNQVIAKLSVP